MIDSNSSSSSSSSPKSSLHPVHENDLFDLARRGGARNIIPSFLAKSNPTTLSLEPELDVDVDVDVEVEVDDTYNYALLIALYTLQGIPLGLSASIPFLIQQKVKLLAESAASLSASTIQTAATAAGQAHIANTADIAKTAYNAQAIFALCSWPFSLKLLWAPIVDAVFIRKFGRRKSWLVPVQFLAGFIMVFGSNYVETQLGLSDGSSSAASASSALDVKGVTAFFFTLYFLMATQDIAVDGWALTMLSKKNRGRGPVCNSIGQNLGYFLAFVGFLALNDPDSSEKLWRPLFRLKSNPDKGLVSLGGFIKSMGVLTITLTTFVAIFKKETNMNGNDNGNAVSGSDDEEDAEIDASEIGVRETYNRLWAVCKLPAVRWLFLILLTNRLPTALSDKVKFLKAVEFGMSKQTTALLAPTIILPLGIAVPIIAAKVFKGHPLRQFMTAYKLRVTLVPILDVLMLYAVKSFHASTDLRSNALFWAAVVSSTALFSIVDSMQFNAQMVFFAHRVDPAIGGTYMTLLNTAANLGSTWPASLVMYMVGQLTVAPTCVGGENGVEEVCSGGVEAYFPLQMVLSIMGCLWIFLMGSKVKQLSSLPDDAWRTHSNDEDEGAAGDLEQHIFGRRNNRKRGKKGD
jgi:PAT family acetyl-CoA transporter-like MFS transporter 1